MSPGQAHDLVVAAYPDVVPDSVIAENGVPRRRRRPIVHRRPGHRGGAGRGDAEPTWLAWTQNLHECFLTLPEPAWLRRDPRGRGARHRWLGHEGNPVTVGSLVLGVMGLVLLFLAVSGLWLWWPWPSRFTASLTVRRGKGRFARDTDLHKVIGMVALPLLLLWGLTGGGLRIRARRDGIWTALTPGTPVTEPEVVSTEGEEPDIGVDTVAAAAGALVPAAEVVAVIPPAADEPAATYTVWLAGRDPYGLTGLSRRPERGGPAHLAADRDQRRSRRTALPASLADVELPGPCRLRGQRVVAPDSLVMGLTPIALAGTGVSTCCSAAGPGCRRQARA